MLLKVKALLFYFIPYLHWDILEIKVYIFIIYLLSCNCKDNGVGNWISRMHWSININFFILIIDHNFRLPFLILFFDSIEFSNFNNQKILIIKKMNFIILCLILHLLDFIWFTFLIMFFFHFFFLSFNMIFVIRIWWEEIDHFILEWKFSVIFITDFCFVYLLILFLFYWEFLVLHCDSILVINN